MSHRRLGPRGEGWVVLQIAVIAAVVAAGVAGPPWPGAATPWREVAAALAALGGVALLGGAAAALGRQLTPLPRPVAGGGLRDRGVYARARHPMYGGALLLVLAFALASSPVALAPTAAAAAFLDAKRRVEEAWLLERHPEYESYRRRVRWRFLPYVW